jgi:hypothetical protein
LFSRFDSALGAGAFVEVDGATVHFAASFDAPSQAGRPTWRSCHLTLLMCFAASAEADGCPVGAVAGMADGFRVSVACPEFFAFAGCEFGCAGCASRRPVAMPLLASRAVWTVVVAGLAVAVVLAVSLL